MFPHILIEQNDAQPILDNYGFTAKDIINLCGGIPAPHISNIRVSIVATYSSALSIQICADQYEVARNMDFEIERIDNNYMYVHEKRQGIGTNLFLTQASTALQHGFRKIHLTAMGPEDGLDWKDTIFGRFSDSRIQTSPNIRHGLLKWEETNRRSVSLYKHQPDVHYGKNRASPG